jgi:integrase
MRLCGLVRACSSSIVVQKEDVMESVALLDCAGRRRSPATLSGFHQGRSPRNKGLRYPPDPPTVEEIIAVMCAAGDSSEGARLRGVIVVLWRAGLRISEGLALTESDLDRARGAVTVRHGKGGKRREVGMDRWAWEQLDPWLELRTSLPVGALFCVLRGPTRGRPCAPAGIRGQLRATAEAAGVRRRFAPHQLRHAHAVEMSREGIRCWSSSGSSGTPTSESPPPTCSGSITRRSSTPSTNAPHP